MNIRKHILWNYHKLRGYSFPSTYEKIIRDINNNNIEHYDKQYLSDILIHCKKEVPFYKDLNIPSDIDKSPYENIISILRAFPVMTKDRIRANVQDLRSRDIGKRKWYFNTSGGSTGEPIRLIQDREYCSRAAATSFLYYWLVGHEVGRKIVRLWGSERDIFLVSGGAKARIESFLWNITQMNAFRMTPEKMRLYLSQMDSKRPDLILAYAQSIYELALFAEQKDIKVSKQRAIMTSAGTLYPFMREKIESVFRCKVFNRYGSREVGAIACEHPGSGGLWVAPWGNYVEIVDENDIPVPDGVEGDILVTSLNNFAMPLIRYKIGDRGILAPNHRTVSGLKGRTLLKVSGRNVDMFKRRDGTLIDGEYFTHLLYFRDWVRKFQFIQKDFDLLHVNVIKAGDKVPESDIEEITRKIRILLGEDCRVEFHFPEEIPESSSGKYRYTISEVQ